VTKRQKRNVLRGLLAAHAKAVDLEVLLRIGGEPQQAAAEAAGSRADELAEAIDKLRARAWQEWTGSAKRLEQEIEQRGAALQTAIRSLERKARSAQAVARALALLDELVWIAVGVARPGPSV
jgi:hypothetical protein